MKTSLRHLFNYWLPPGHSSGNETPNPLVEAAIKIQVSTAAMLAGAEVDWEEIKRENEEWFRLLKEASPSQLHALNQHPLQRIERRNHQRK